MAKRQSKQSGHCRNKCTRSLVVHNIACGGTKIFVKRAVLFKLKFTLSYKNLKIKSIIYKHSLTLIYAEAK